MNTLLRAGFCTFALIGFQMAFAGGAAAIAARVSATGLAQLSVMDTHRTAGDKRPIDERRFLTLAQVDDDDDDDEEGVSVDDPAGVVGQIITGIISQQQSRKCERWEDRCDRGDARACRNVERYCADN